MSNTACTASCGGSSRRLADGVITAVSWQDRHLGMNTTEIRFVVDDGSILSGVPE